MHRKWIRWRGGCRAPHFPPLAHQRVSEEDARLILVVRAAAELDVVDRSGAASGVRLDVVELEERRLAASPRGPDECAASLIALPHCTFYDSRNVTARGGNFSGAPSR